MSIKEKIEGIVRETIMYAVCSQLFLLKHKEADDAIQNMKDVSKDISTQILKAVVEEIGEDKEVRDYVLAQRFIEDKIQESEDFIKGLEGKEFLDSQQRLMLRAEKQEKRFYEYALECILTKQELREKLG